MKAFRSLKKPKFNFLKNFFFDKHWFYTIKEVTSQNQFCGTFSEQTIQFLQPGEGGEMVMVGDLQRTQPGNTQLKSLILFR